MRLLNGLKLLKVIQVGCGGTGGWLAPHIIKFLSNLHTRFNRTTPNNLLINYTLVDNDTIEAHNILRQNFTYDDLGITKVDSIFRRFLGLCDIIRKEIKLETYKDFQKLLFKTQLEKDIVSNTDNYLYIIIGCVDNVETRLNLIKWCKKTKYSIIYLDSGNELDFGQIISQSYKLDKITDKTDQTVIFPDFPKYEKKQEKIKNLFTDNDQNENAPAANANAGCAFFGDQSQSINNLAAGYLFMVMQNLLINNKLPSYSIYFNTLGNSIAKNYTE